MTERTNRRSKSFLTGKRVSADLDREVDIIEGIKRGLTDAAAGRVVPHEEAMAEIDAVIDAVQAKRTED
jgi:predicted transcriptional regulator